MTRLPVSAALVALLACTAIADPNEGPIPLHKAFNDGLVSVQVTSVTGYSRVFLRIRNLECGRRSLRLPGTYLRPGNPRYQRLALGYAELNRNGNIAIEEGKTWEGWVTSCCMDSGLGTPGGNTSMTICREQAPDDISRIMAEWAANPGKSQSDVNGLVWGVNRPQAPSAPRVPRLQAESAEMILFGDRIMVRFASGDLLRLRDDGRWQVLAIGADKVGVGPAGIFARFGVNSVKAFNETARDWSDVAALDSIERIVPGAGGAMAVAGGSLFRLDSGHWRVVRNQIQTACTGFEVSGQSVYAVTRGRKLLQGGDGYGEWKISARSDYFGAYPTATTLYAMDSRGIVALKRDGESRILFCSPTSDVRHWQGGLFVRKQGENAVLEYREGKGWDRHTLPDSTALVSADPVSGRLCALLSNGRIMTLTGSGTWACACRLPHCDPGNVTAGMLFDPEGGVPAPEKPPVTDMTERG